MENGKVVETLIDVDGDSKADYQFNDTNGDGKFDVVHMDADNTDGILETTMTTAEYGAGALGSVAEYESLIAHPTSHDDSAAATNTDSFDV